PEAQRFRQQTGRQAELLRTRLALRLWQDRPETPRCRARYLGRITQPGVLWSVRCRAEALALRPGDRALPAVSDLLPVRPIRTLRIGRVVHGPGGQYRKYCRAVDRKDSLPPGDRDQPVPGRGETR